MLILSKTIKAWNSADFEKVLAQEVAELGLEHLPLQEGLTQSSVALDSNIKVIVLSVRKKEGNAIIDLGVFYSGIIPGCSCADDPTPVDEINEYCELTIDLELKTGLASISSANNQ